MTSENKIVRPRFASFTETWHENPYDAISPLRPELSVTGKSVVVTGGGTGIGKAIAKAFAQANASSVAILGRREDRLKEAITEISNAIDRGKCKLLYEAVDVSRLEPTKQAIDNIVQKQGQKIDILVCNAGALVDPKKALECDIDEWMQAFDYNVRIPFNTIQAFIPHATKNATLINISSGIAHMKPIPRLSAHGASKAAGVRLMEYILVENPDFHVVSIQPGSVDTEMSRQAGSPGKDHPDLAGGFCVWLVSQEASFLNGKFVWVNWDVEEMKQRAEEIKTSRLLSPMLQGVAM